jgi:hypothetical protein
MRDKDKLLNAARNKKNQMARSRTKSITMQKRASGMARFFSKSNRDRYRKLASGTISRVEQHQLLDDLAQEMDAFKREARCCLSPAAEDVAPYQCGTQDNRGQISWQNRS